MTTFAPTEVRASGLARCPRMETYRGLGVETPEPDDQSRRYFARGHLYTHYVCKQLEAKFGSSDVEREVAIHHPLGTGHADAYIRSIKTLVEIKSTVAPFPNSPTFEQGVEQLRIYLAYHPEADVGRLYMVNPSSLDREDEYEVGLTDDDRERIRRMMLEVSRALGGGELPQRVCTRPSQARGRMCPFAETCFEGWTEPPATEISDPVALEAASELAAVKMDEKIHKDALKALGEGRKDAEARLADLVPVGKSVVGPYELVRTHVQRQPSFSVRAYQAAGLSLEPLAKFFQPGAEYDTWKVSRVASVGDVDFGEEAPF